jgi:hypothetical protein
LIPFPKADIAGGVDGPSAGLTLVLTPSTREDAEERRLGVEMFENALSAPELRRRLRFSSLLVGS